MIGTDETNEMIISKKLKPIISKKLYCEKAKETQPDIHFSTGKYKKTNSMHI